MVDFVAFDAGCDVSADGQAAADRRVRGNQTAQSGESRYGMLSLVNTRSKASRLLFRWTPLGGAEKTWTDANCEDERLSIRGRTAAEGKGRRT